MNMIHEYSKDNTQYTPMMQHYLEIKGQHPESLVLYRMGDFYELFFEDAIKASKLLGITLTSRSKTASTPIPMAGIPFHALDNYLNRMVNDSCSVVIVEQFNADSNSIQSDMEYKVDKKIERRISRIITPGTLVDANLLIDKIDNIALAISLLHHKSKLKKSDCIFGIAILSVSTGSLQLTFSNYNNLLDKIQSINPAEVIIADNFYAEYAKIDKDNLINELKHVLSKMSIKTMPFWHFDYELSYKNLCKHFNVLNLEGFAYPYLNNAYSNACFNDYPAELSKIIAASVLLTYVKNNMQMELLHITSILSLNEEKYLLLDAISKRNLEISINLQGGKNNTLFNLLNSCNTTMGSRYLFKLLNQPPISHIEINNRLNSVEILYDYYTKHHNLALVDNHADSFSDISDILVRLVDIDRVVSRITLKIVKPKELISLLNSLMLLPKLKELITKINITVHKNNQSISSALQYNLFENIHYTPDDVTQIDCNFSLLPSEIIDKLTSALFDNPQPNIKEGGVIRDNYNTELDELRKLANHGSQFIADLEIQERERTGISSLKIEYNKIHGYYIELPIKYSTDVPEDYKRTQILKNVERYTTKALKDYEYKVLRSMDMALQLEKKLYDDLLDYLSNIVFIKSLQELAKALSIIDVLNNFAKLAIKNKYVRPQLVDYSMINITEGRHPIIVNYVEHFIANSVSLNDNNKFLLITGPNMGGKSTYMRQTALIVLMAYCASFVPASGAVIGVVDKIFTRIGASDDLASGKSTFMVEMSETANILNNATNNSLVLLDEIGRGTSSIDGISLAYAISKHLISKVMPYVLFATHYFELTQDLALENKVKNMHFNAILNNDNIVFLHNVQDGAIAKSYGIEIAKLAGFPKSVINLAKQYLSRIEFDATKNNHMPNDLLSPLELNTEGSVDNEMPAINEIYDILQNLQLDQLSPKDALNILYDLREKLI